tara:strand:- start:199 stop:567 length:369 start_codon:yes stop_codon:yes gene_type:complete
MKMKILFLACALSFNYTVAYGQAMDCSNSHSMHTMHLSDYSKEYMKSMCDMMSQMDKYPLNGNASHDFAAMMIPHHEAAVEMAKTLLKDPNANASLLKMANDIISSQTLEVEAMIAFLAANP